MNNQINCTTLGPSKCSHSPFILINSEKDATIEEILRSYSSKIQIFFYDGWLFINDKKKSFKLSVWSHGLHLCCSSFSSLLTKVFSFPCLDTTRFRLDWAYSTPIMPDFFRNGFHLNKKYLQNGYIVKP